MLAADNTTTQAPDVLREREVRRRTGLSGPTLWRARQRGEFPQPIQLSPGRKGYLRVEVERWLEQRAAARNR